MEFSSDNLMGSNVINNVPSPSPSSSSSSSCSWRIHPMMEHESDESHVAKFLDRKLGPHEASRLIIDDNVENDKTLNLGFEQPEPEALMLMFEKGLKGDKLENFVGEKGMKLNKLKDIRIEEEPKKSEKGKGVNVYNKKLCEEIELLESMLKRGSYGLVDLQMMMEEVKGLKGSRKMVSDIKMKISELESELYDLKKAIVELKCKKSKELMMGCVKIEEENKGLKCEKREHEDGEEEEDDNVSKTNWGSIIASVGAVVVAATAVFLMGRPRVEVKSERKNRDQTGYNLIFRGVCRNELGF